MSIRGFGWAGLLMTITLVSAIAGCSSDTTAPATSIATATSSEPKPANGLVDIGGRKLEIACAGSGSPVVVLDAGLGNTLDVWARVMSLVEKNTTVCSYNRAGLGRSDPRPEPHGASSAVDDLHALLGAAALKPPYVVVGASFGGLDAQLFARRFPEETSGVVLVDAIAPGWDTQLEAILSPAQVAERRAIPNGEDMTNEDIRSSEDLVGSAPPFPATSLVVLRHGVAFPGDAGWPTSQVEALWLSLQEGLSTLSSKSVLLLAADSGHRIHQDQPNLVADAIMAEVDPARWPPNQPVSAAFGAGPTAPAGALAGHVVFTSATGIEIATGDGGDRHVLVAANDAAPVGEPSIDASGSRLGYSVGAAQPAGTSPSPQRTTDVWTLDIATGAATLVVHGGEGPAISPDGASVAYTNGGHAYVLQLDGDAVRDLGEAGCPVWSPDSSRLALCTADDELVVIRVADLTRTDVATGTGPNVPTAWSPDGTALAVASRRDGNGEVYVVGVDDGSQRRLTNASGTQASGPWTASGLLVTSAAPDPDSNDWFLVDPVTGIAQRLAWMRGIFDPIAWTS